MLRLPRLFVLPACGVVAAVVTIGASSAPQAPAAAEVRGLWVLRTSLTSRESIADLVRLAETGGFNTLLVQVRGRGEAFYRSAIEPRASDLDARPASFDPLATTLELAHRAGLRVHAWVNVNLVASAATVPRSRDHIVSRHPEWLMLPEALASELHGVDAQSPGYVGRLVRWTRSVSEQRVVEGLYLSPIPAGAREYTASVVAELVSTYAVDGIHFDYTRYPNDEFDYSAVALDEFRTTRVPAMSVAERQRLDRLAADDPAIWARMYPETWAAFRRDRLTQLVMRLRAVAKTARPDIVVSAAVAPDAAEARAQRLQDWPAWMAAGALDVVCPMAYTTDLDEFTALITQVKALAGTAPVWAGIGAFQLSMARTADHVRAARRAGVGGTILFSYDSLNALDAQKGGSFAELRRLLAPSIGEGARR